MVERTVTIKNKTGLHARPAAQFVQTANKFKSNITITKDGKTADAKSIITVLSMGINKGSEIILCAEGPDESKAVDTLVELINGFKEE
ncbi:MAG: phosphocarrier protein HPr [Thermosediminibacterales bacterium]|nr:phosphocarrier protein HPr [Thermosediminibacterales bacterium]MDK2835829.1 phosphocarrier protein HPr [Thermosediminibacterales bacterium]